MYFISFGRRLFPSILTFLTVNISNTLDTLQQCAQELMGC